VSTLYLRGTVFYVGFPDENGRWHKKTTATRDRTVAKAIGRMLDELGHRGKQNWGLLHALIESRLDLPRLYAAFSANKLDELTERLNDVDLEPFVREWLDTLKGRVSIDTREHYETHVRSLLVEGQSFPRSDLTFERITTWLRGRAVKDATKRKYHAALSSFCQYLKLRRVLAANPMRDVRAPSASRPRDRYLDHDEVLKLLEALAEPYRTVTAISHGSGAELSAVLAMRRRDVDLDADTLRIRGTKTAYRDRTVHLEPWALVFLKRHLKRSRLLPDALVFPGLNRWTVSDKHREASDRVGLAGYQLRDARHTYAVRAVRAGAPFEIVARQLGHADPTMVARVYGRFRPSSEEMRRVHELMELRDKKSRRAR
jgi:integrase